LLKNRLGPAKTDGSEKLGHRDTKGANESKKTFHHPQPLPLIHERRRERSDGEMSKSTSSGLPPAL
jgi:hypothetical protein